MAKGQTWLETAGTHRYDSIIDMEYPLKNIDLRKHPRMSIQDRAKIFAPFAALKGYEDAIATKQRLVVPRIELTEESKAELDLKFIQLEQMLQEGQHPVVTVVYFQKTENPKEKNPRIADTASKDNSKDKNQRDKNQKDKNQKDKNQRDKNQKEMNQREMELEFQDCALEETGEYIQLTGMVSKFNRTARVIQIVNVQLKLEDIYEI